MVEDERRRRRRRRRRRCTGGGGCIEVVEVLGFIVLGFILTRGSRGEHLA